MNFKELKSIFQEVPVLYPVVRVTADQVLGAGTVPRGSFGILMDISKNPTVKVFTGSGLRGQIAAHCEDLQFIRYMSKREIHRIQASCDRQQKESA